LLFVGANVVLFDRARKKKNEKTTIGMLFSAFLGDFLEKCKREDVYFCIFATV